MGFLPEVIEGKIVMPEKGAGRKLYTPPVLIRHKEEERMAEFNNMGHKEVAKDFSDSSALD